MKPDRIWRELVPRAIFATGLLVVSAIGVFIVGMSGDGGPNPVTYYLMGSLAWFVCAGLAVLCTPTDVLFSSGRAGRWLRLGFLSSIANPILFVATLAAIRGLSGDPPRPPPRVAPARVDTRVCITQHAVAPGRPVRVFRALDASAPEPVPSDRMLQPAERYCEWLPLQPASELRFRARAPVAPAPATPGTGRPPGHIQPEGVFHPTPGETLCIGLYPVGTGKSDDPGAIDDPLWHFIREPCEPEADRDD